MSGSVYLIGAGCGRYDLITLRGLNALQKCDVIVYDALIDENLLEYAQENAELICVGKRAGKHSAAQDEINAVLVRKALDGHTVARLKGGDPFVFGRGGEEISELRKHGIAYEVIPGISSPIAVPELAGIPVTHRKTSRSFHVITAHTADGTQDFSQYARLGGTLVFLMGLNSLGNIADSLMNAGKPCITPAAVISEGCTARQRTVRGTLADIAERAEKAGITAPAVIVVGDTAALDYAGTAKKLPLAGVSVTVTGTRKFTEKAGSLLESEGADIRRYSNITIGKKRDIPPLDGYDCIAFTSSYGAEIFIEHCREKRIDLRKFAGMKIAAVGSGTAGTLAAAGIYADIVPEKYTVRDLGEAIAGSVTGRVLILRAERGSDGLNKTLDERGAAFDDVKIYDTVSRGLPPITTDSDYIVFGSSSGVQSFFESGSTVSADTKIVCIGAQTAETAGQHTSNTIITAFPHTAAGVADAIKEDRK